jgi:hypothetical protein
LLGWLLSLRRGVLIAFDMRFLGQCSITTAAGARFEHNEQYMNIWLDGGLPYVFESAWYMQCIHAAFRVYLQAVKHADGYLPTYMAAVGLIIIVESRSFSPCHPAVSISIGLSVLYG